MKKVLLTFLLTTGIAAGAAFAQNDLFDDQQVAAIHVNMPPDSFQLMINQLINDRYLSATFVFDTGNRRDTVANVGIRLRGNTSLGAQKKSFKISFNEFTPGASYQGIKKINLRGQHNDPTMIREKLFYDVWEKAGMPQRRTAFVRLFINGQYRGLYTNVEEIDKQWLDRAYGDNDGNLYKCTWPADLAYLGSNQQTYKNILNNPTTRAYDLVTNESEDDYSDLVNLITQLNQPVNGNFAGNIQQTINVNAVLKAYAIDIATGNWDDYFYNKNNYYLYNNPETGRFEYMTFDTDNTFGVDWLGIDWAKRYCRAWHHPSQPRPLATKLLAVPAFQQQFIRYLDTLAREILHPDSIFPRIDALHALIAPAAIADTYRTLDYGYTVSDFYNGLTQTIDGHTPYGIKPFIGLRRDSIMSQIAPVLTGADSGLAAGPDPLVLFPNPLGNEGWLQAHIEMGETHVQVFNLAGELMQAFDVILSSENPVRFSTTALPPGVYVLNYFNHKIQGKVRLLIIPQ